MVKTIQLSDKIHKTLAIMKAEHGFRNYELLIIYLLKNYRGHKRC